jgi:hypothetical protein
MTAGTDNPFDVGFHEELQVSVVRVFGTVRGFN